jgi:WD40 repeat protein/serine/threonine protein kinase
MQPATPRREPVDQLGDFRIVREVGRGGMGVVYEAEQVSLGRRVALKLLPHRGLLDARQRQRFEREAKAAAKLHHTNIVPVFGTGEHDGQPYYVMQLIDGQGLDAVIEALRRGPPGGATATPPGATDGAASAVARSLLTGHFAGAAPSPDGLTVDLPGEARPHAEPPSAPVALPGSGVNSSSGARRPTFWRGVANIGAQVADALEYAHKQGVLHRDVKPSNLLLDARGTVWVTDFGLAKADDQPHLTNAGDILGTLRYMPPEAFDGTTDARTDVYALGLTLYELLALRPAFGETDRNKLIKQVTQGEPPRLDRVNHAVPRDLVTIVHKAADRDPARRYQTTGELAADLRRFLADEPIKARRVSPVERYLRWARRNPGIAVLGGVLTAVLVLATAASLLAAGYFNRLRLNETEAAQRERDARRAAEEAADEARRRSDAERRQRYRSNLAAAGSALQLQSSGAARRALQAAPAEYRDWEWLHFASRLDEARLVLAVGGEVEHLAFGPDGKQLAAWNGDGARVWDAATGREVGLLAEPTGVLDLAFRPGGRQPLALLGDGTLLSWDPATKDRQVLLRIPYEKLDADTFSPDRSLLVGMRDNAGQLWDVSAGRKRADLSGRPTTGIGGAAAFSPDGRHFAYGTVDRAIHVWDLVTGAEAYLLRGHTSPIRVLAISPDGKRLASGSIFDENCARLWDVTTGKEIAALRGHRNTVVSVAFSPDGTRLATASLDQTARLWDGVTGREIATLRGHRGPVNHVVFRPDGRRLVTASADGTLRLWDATAGEPLAVLYGHAGAAMTSVFDPGGAALASASFDGTVRLWDMGLVERSGVLRGHTSYVYDVAFSPDGTRAASAAWDGTARLWDPTSCLPILPPLPGGDLPMVGGVCFRPDGKQLVSAGADGFLRVWDAAAGKLLRKLRCPVSDWRLYARAAFDPTGTVLSAGGADGLIRLWGADGDEPIATLTGHEGAAGDVAFRPDGARLASGGIDKTVRVWDVATRQPVAVLRGHTGIVTRVAYSADGRLLASASEDKTARLWDATTGEALAVLPHGSIVYGVAFNPGGTRLAAACADNTIRLWDVGLARRAGGKEAPDAEVAELRGHDAYVHAVDWSPDGTRLISASGDGTVRVWDSLPPAVRARPADAYVPPRGYVCGRAAGPIAFDGRLDDGPWKDAPWTDDFVDIEGDKRIKPRFRTRAKMLWDDRYFYIGAELEEPHVQGSYTEHDSFIFHEDNDFEVFLNPDGDNHNYAELEMNALNTTWDLRLNKPYLDGGKAEHSWEIPGLKTAVHVHGTINNPRDIDKGWTVEIAIPWEIVGALHDDPGRPGRPRDGDQWRVNFSRVEWMFDIVDGKYVRRTDRREDNWVWSPQGVVNMHRPETWGYVQFSTEAPGKAAFRPDPAGPVRHLLQRVYSAQYSYQEERGRYARTPEELGLTGLDAEGLVGSVRLEGDGSGFQAVADVRYPDGSTRRWRIREDSRVWQEK